jgi:hypothetical protein
MRFAIRLQRACLITVLAAQALVLAACDGSVVFTPHDNTRLDKLSSPAAGAPYRIHVMLNEAQHRYAISHTWREAFRLEGYSSAVDRWISGGLRRAPRFSGVARTLAGGRVTGPSYWWEIPIDLYDLGIFEEPGTWGTSFKFRLSVRNGSKGAGWDKVPGITVDWRECNRMTRAGATYCPSTYEVRLRAPDYVPNVTRGDTHCGAGDDDCSACVADLPQQVGAPGVARTRPGEPLDINDWNWRWTLEDFVDGAYGTFSHNQGVARLGDAMIDGSLMGRLVMTANPNDDPPRGLYLGVQRIVGADEGIFSRDQDHDFVRSFRIMDVDAYGDHHHPGGIQAHRNIVAVAMEEGRHGHGAVYFLRVDGDNIRYLHTLSLDGSQDEPLQASQNSAATVGFVKLEGGTFLLAVSGRHDGRQGIWFYESADTTISEYTNWHYVDFYHPPCLGYGSNSDECYVGAGGALNLVTDCSGQVYLLAMHGTAQTAGREYEYFQVFRVDQTPQRGTIRLDKIAQQRDNLGLLAIDDESFRWSGGSYVTRSGGLALMNSERRNREGSNGSVRGDVYLDSSHVR